MTTRPVWFRVLAVLVLLWNLVGLFMFWQEMTLTPAAVAALPAAQQQIHAAMPPITHLFFGIAVAAGVLGSIALVLAKRWAVPSLLLSLLAICAQMGTAFATTPVWRLMGMAGVLPPLLLIVACLLAWLLARLGARRGWLS